MFGSFFATLRLPPFAFTAAFTVPLPGLRFVLPVTTCTAHTGSLLRLYLPGSHAAAVVPLPPAGCRFGCRLRAILRCRLQHTRTAAFWLVTVAWLPRLLVGLPAHAYARCTPCTTFCLPLRLGSRYRFTVRTAYIPRYRLRSATVLRNTPPRTHADTTVTTVTRYVRYLRRFGLRATHTYVCGSGCRLVGFFYTGCAHACGSRLRSLHAGLRVPVTGYVPVYTLPVLVYWLRLRLLHVYTFTTFAFTTFTHYGCCRFTYHPTYVLQFTVTTHAVPFTCGCSPFTAFFLPVRLPLPVTGWFAHTIYAGCSIPPIPAVAYCPLRLRTVAVAVRTRGLPATHTPVAAHVHVAAVGLRFYGLHACLRLFYAAGCRLPVLRTTVGYRYRLHALRTDCPRFAHTRSHIHLVMPHVCGCGCSGWILFCGCWLRLHCVAAYARSFWLLLPRLRTPFTALRLRSHIRFFATFGWLRLRYFCTLPLLLPHTRLYLRLPLRLPVGYGFAVIYLPGSHSSLRATTIAYAGLVTRFVGSVRAPVAAAARLRIRGYSYRYTTHTVYTLRFTACPSRLPVVHAVVPTTRLRLRFGWLLVLHGYRTHYRAVVAVTACVTGYYTTAVGYGCVYTPLLQFTLVLGLRIHLAAACGLLRIPRLPHGCLRSRILPLLRFYGYTTVGLLGSACRYVHGLPLLPFTVAAVTRLPAVTTHAGSPHHLPVLLVITVLQFAVACRYALRAVHVTALYPAFWFLDCY